MNDDLLTVSAAEFQRNMGTYQDKALTGPVMITKNGRERTVLLSAEEYRRLKKRDRQVLALDDMTDADVAAVASSEVDPKYGYLNDELKDWKP